MKVMEFGGNQTYQLKFRPAEDDGIVYFCLLTPGFAEIEFKRRQNVVFGIFVPLIQPTPIIISVSFITTYLF